MSGYWEPHSSSIDFCESNYIITNYIVEPYNTFSSLIFFALGLFGYYYSNVTKEKRFSLLFVLMWVIGIGSMSLHATLHWSTQSFDEVPMLWLNMGLLYNYCVIYRDNKDSSSKMIAYIFFFITFVETIVYYSLQSLYFVFVTTFIVTAVMVTLFNVYYVYYTTRNCTDPDSRVLIYILWTLVSICLVYVGFAFAWVLDMQFCNELLPMYARLPIFNNGWTLHVIWHVAAGYGGYFQILMLEALRIILKKKEEARLSYPSLKWKCFIFPYIHCDKE